MTNKTELDNKLKSIIDELPNKIVETILLKHDYYLEHKPNGLRKVMLFDLIENKGEYISPDDYQDEIDGLESMLENSRKIKKIERLIKETDNNLVKSVFKMVLDNLENPTDQDLKRYVFEIMEYGCKSGIVPQLIFTVDNRDFVKNHLDEIIETLNECDINISPINVDQLCWTAFEMTLRLVWENLDDIN